MTFKRIFSAYEAFFMFLVRKGIKRTSFTALWWLSGAPIALQLALWETKYAGN